MKKILLAVLLFIVVVVVAGFVYLFVGFSSPAENITWGVNFSSKHARAMGLDWKETYTALLDDLGVRNLKIAVHWDYIQPREGEFDFEDLDWQMSEASSRDAEVLLVVGMKTPRWPECHVPGWAKDMSKEEQQSSILFMLKEVVERYKEHPALSSWQVENEPFFVFGDCPWRDDDFFEQEVEFVRSLDPGHPIVVSDSGEFSFWTKAAQIGDVVGVTLYRKVWFSEFNRYITYPFPPVYYSRKADIITTFYGTPVMGIEVQAEPWGPALLYDVSVEEQKKTMTAERFVKNIEFAKNTGFDTLYLWGAEWWYWMKEIEGDESVWKEAEKVFAEG